MTAFALLHLSDWHLGKPLGRVDRRPDHEDAIAKTIQIARDRRPDLVLHTGDVFDTWRPALEDLRTAVRAFRELAKIAPVLVLAGNHDSEDLFRWLDELLADEGIRFMDRPRHPDDGGVFEYPMTGGGTARIAGIPFVHANRSLDRAFEDPANRMSNYADRLRRVQSDLGGTLLQRTDPAIDVAVLACHLHITGAQITRSERQLHVTDSYAVHAAAMPDVAYIACGHIHKPQKLPGMLEAHYAGSAIALDFGEEHDEKRLVLCTLTPGRPTTVESIPIAAGRPLRRLEGTLAEIAALAGDVGSAICRVVVQSEQRTPGLADQLAELLPDAELLEVIERAASAPDTLTDPGEQAEQERLEDLFVQYAGEQPTGQAPVRLVTETFSELLTALATERPASFPELTAVETGEH